MDDKMRQLLVIGVFQLLVSKLYCALMVEAILGNNTADPSGY
jgi:hypothetical protein